MTWSWPLVCGRDCYCCCVCDVHFGEGNGRLPSRTFTMGSFMDVAEHTIGLQAIPEGQCMC